MLFEYRYDTWLVWFVRSFCINFFFFFCSVFSFCRRLRALQKAVKALNARDAAVALLKLKNVDSSDLICSDTKVYRCSSAADLVTLANTNNATELAAQIENAFNSWQSVFLSFRASCKQKIYRLLFRLLLNVLLSFSLFNSLFAHSQRNLLRRGLDFRISITSERTSSLLQWKARRRWLWRH